MNQAGPTATATQALTGCLPDLVACRNVLVNGAATNTDEGTEVAAVAPVAVHYPCSIAISEANIGIAVHAASMLHWLWRAFIGFGVHSTNSPVQPCAVVIVVAERQCES